jgi:hypothetical protein
VIKEKIFDYGVWESADPYLLYEVKDRTIRHYADRVDEYARPRRGYSEAVEEDLGVQRGGLEPELTLGTASSDEIGGP